MKKTGRLPGSTLTARVVCAVCFLAFSFLWLFWFQADLLAVPLDRPESVECTAMGAAMLAGLKCGFWTKEDLPGLRRSSRIFTPEMGDEERRKRYDGWLKALHSTIEHSKQ